MLNTNIVQAELIQNKLAYFYFRGEAYIQAQLKYQAERNTKSMRLILSLNSLQTLQRFVCPLDNDYFCKE